MTEMFRCRIDRSLLRKADQVSHQMGTTTSELVRIFLRRLATQKALPFSSTPKSEEDEVLGPLVRRRALANLFHEG